MCQRAWHTFAALRVRLAKQPYGVVFGKCAAGFLAPPLISSPPAPRAKGKTMQTFTPSTPVYFGGSRHGAQAQPHAAAIGQSVRAALAAGCPMHVGCQFGVDAQVILSALTAGGASLLVVFAVAPTLAAAPLHVQQAARAGARVVLAAGGQSAPIPARFLLRSLAAAAGCQCALFFAPGAGSQAVIRRLSIPVYVTGSSQPASQPALF